MMLCRSSCFAIGAMAHLRKWRLQRARPTMRMGAVSPGWATDFADYDNDGAPDIFVNALATQRYSIFHNRKGTFHYVSDSTGVGRASILHSGWGAKFEDFDNDGWKDLFVGQGHVMDNIQLSLPQVRYLEAPLLMRNVAGNFVDVSATAGPAFQKLMAARGVAFGDLNNDGWVDVVMNCNDQPAMLLENRPAGGNHWLTVNTVGTTSNRDGIGTRIRLVAGVRPATVRDGEPRRELSVFKRQARAFRTGREPPGETAGIEMAER